MKKRKYRKVSLKPLIRYWHPDNIIRKVRFYGPAIDEETNRVTFLGGFQHSYVHKTTGEPVPRDIIAKILEEQQKHEQKTLKKLFGSHS